jgi:bifunctional non-homologous end joining protein LigD
MLPWRREYSAAKSETRRQESRLPHQLRIASAGAGDEVQFYAFDILAGDGDDMRGLPLSIRKANLARLMGRRSDGIFIAPFEQGEIGADLFRAACGMGLEGLVSKHRDRPYRAERSPHWIKVKNPGSKAMTRAREVDWKMR